MYHFLKYCMLLDYYPEMPMTYLYACSLQTLCVRIQYSGALEPW